MTQSLVRENKILLALFEVSKVIEDLFHVEVTKGMILEWFKDSPEINHIMEETEKIYEEYVGRAMNFYKVFFERDDNVVELLGRDAETSSA